MAFSPWQKFIVDGTGNVITDAEITVRLESSGALATIYSDPGGTAKSNPFTVTSAGLARFYAAGGIYKVVVNEGDADEVSFRYEHIGSAAALDQGAADSEVQTNDDNRDEFAQKRVDVSEVAGTTYTVTETDNGTMIKTTSSSDVTITLPSDATEALADGFQVAIQMGGTGTVTIQTEGSDSLTSADDIFTISTQYAAAFITKEASGVWTMFGGIEPILAAGVDTGDVPAWNGLGWQPGYGLADLGFVNVVDDVYTAGSPKAVTGGARTQLDITYGASSDDTYAPRGVVGGGTGGWWDDTTNAFFPQNVGDTYDVRVSFKCDPTVNNDTILLEYSIDEGASPPDVISAKHIRLATSSGVIGQVSETVAVFALNTFNANGCKFFITPGANMDVYDMSVLISKKSDGRA